MPRKPRQQRSRATVDAIVEAGFLCVAQHGVAHTTTRHIADVAGIGVGSLYEYFDNKEAVFDAMNKRLVDDVVALIREVTPDMVEMEIQPAIEFIFKRFGDFLTRDNDRYLKVARQVVQADTRDYVEPVSQALMDLLMRYVVAHPKLMQLDNIPALSYLLINGGIFSVLRQLSSENPPVTLNQLSHTYGDLIATYLAQKLPATEQAKTRSEKRGNKRLRVMLRGTARSCAQIVHAEFIGGSLLTRVVMTACARAVSL